ncbi:MAG: glycosyltransferase family 2 protein [Paracoccaceae bacterium]
MSDPRLRLNKPRLVPGLVERTARLPLGRHLVNAGVISASDLINALNQQRHIEAPLGEILIAENLVDSETVLDALALQYEAERVDLLIDPPDDRLSVLLPPEICVRHQIVPWMQLGDVMLIATSRPDQLEHIRPHLPDLVGAVLPVITSEKSILTYLAKNAGQELAARAENRVKPSQSCRSWGGKSVARSSYLLGIALILAGALISSPIWTFSILVLIAAATLLISTGMKSMAFAAQIATRDNNDRPLTTNGSASLRLPRMSIMVPLLHEKEIAQALIARLSRLTYPKALLDVVLVLEERDEVTKETLTRTKLPPWMKVIEVPYVDGLTTKPRALNYALDFCRGTIVGVWDAEDTPEPGQLETVAHHFHEAPPKVACLQGILDYYNPRANWLSRCFTIEYATWWRIIMPGLSRLGFVIPLGGTTLFFRRDALEEVQGWDAHNVTEDADLGFRLARYGFRTELIPTVTHEEATCRPWAWIRQRSRWLKGFMVTYLVHMRHPRQLMADLGARKFWGFQVFFLAAISQFILAPLLWSFWLVFLGFSHPLNIVVGNVFVLGLSVAFVLCEIVTIGIGLVAVSGKNHRHLMAWVPTLLLYFPLGTVASYKAIYELAVMPFFWDKTQHGHSLNQRHDVMRALRVPSRPA